METTTPHDDALVRVEETFAATPEGLAAAAAFLEEGLTRAVVPMATAMKLQIACDEIVSNIVKFSGASTFTVKLVRTVEPGRCELTFIDAGKPWNPLAHADPDITLPLEDRPLGGLGIMLVKKLMDNVTYAREGNANVLRMIRADRA